MMLEEKADEKAGCALAMTESESQEPFDSALPSTGRIALVLGFLCAGCLLQGATYSHVTSFFNNYALEEKGLSSTQYGIIMGSYCLVFVVITPVAAKVVTSKRFKDNSVMFLAWTVDGFFSIVTSATSHLGKGAPFFFGTLALRVLSAFGCAVGFLMLYIVLATEMNHLNHIVIPLLETVYGLSVVIGPAFSGALYDCGGYSLPFWAIGGALLLLMLLALMVFPNPRPVENDEDCGEPMKLSQVLEFPIIVNVLCAMNGFILVSFNESTLARQLNLKFGMSASESGLMFLAAGGPYAFASLFFGFISRRIPDSRYLVLSSSVLAVLGLILQGPIIPIEQTRTTIMIAQMLLGLGVGSAYVCSYLQSLKYLGSESKETYAALSSVFTPATSLGCTIGPLSAGIIVDHFSYRTGIIINAAQLVCVMTLLLVTTCFMRSQRRPTAHGSNSVKGSKATLASH